MPYDIQQDKKEKPLEKRGHKKGHIPLESLWNT
jgi:hypothetical protein